MKSFIEFINERKEIGLAKKAELSLSTSAKAAIKDWIYDMGGPLERDVRSNGPISQELEKAFAPIREVMRKEYGEQIKLYRGVREDANFKGSTRSIQSWTSDKKAAETYSGHRSVNGVHVDHNYTSPEQLKQYVNKFNKTGLVVIGDRTYKKDGSDPDYYNVYDKSRKVIDSGEVEEFEDDLNSMLNTQKKNVQGKVIEKFVAIDKIVWVTNDHTQKEYIVKT